MEKNALTVQEFQAELKKYVQQKKKENPRFSVRSLALKLNVEVSALQKIMRGERNLGIRLAQDLATRMNVEIVRQKTQKLQKPRRWQLSLDSDSEVSVSWLNLAILEMIKLEDFQPNEQWVSKRLGVPVEVVQKALHDMETQNMLQRNEDGWVDLVKDASSGVPAYRSTAAIRQMQREIIEMSKKKMETVDIEQREHGFSILPISSAQLPALKKKIQNFRWELCEMAQNAKMPKDSVYSLQVGFFSLMGN